MHSNAKSNKYVVHKHTKCKHKFFFSKLLQIIYIMVNMLYGWRINKCVDMWYKSRELYFKAPIIRRHFSCLGVIEVEKNFLWAYKSTLTTEFTEVYGLTDCKIAWVTNATAASFLCNHKNRNSDTEAN